MSTYCEGRSSRLYRSRRGILFGVCRGIAEHLDISVFWTRLLVFVAFVMTGFWPVGVVYLLAAFLLKREPGVWRRPEDAEYHTSPLRAGRLKSVFDGLDKRLQRLESVVTRRDFDWDERLNTR